MEPPLARPIIALAGLAILGVLLGWLSVWLVPRPVPAANIAGRQLFPPGCKVTTNEEDSWGVQILLARLSPDRSTLEIRYRLRDLERAARFMKGAGEAVITDTVSGWRTVARPGAAGEAALGKVYSLHFPNDEGLLRQKARVALTVAGMHKTGIAVR